jgi:hypothetical protein
MLTSAHRTLMRMTQGSPQPSFWRSWIDPKQLGTGTVLAFVVVLAAGIVGDSYSILKSEARELVSPDGEPRVIKEIASRDIWVTRPRTFGSAADRPQTGHVNASSGGADFIVVTPDALVRNAPDYEGLNIILVGKVALSVQLPSDEGFAEELTLATDHNRLAFIRRDVPEPTEETTMHRRGDVVFALGRLAAVGRARDPTGRQHQAAYFLATWVQDYFFQVVGSGTLDESLNGVLRMYGLGRGIRPVKP